MISAQSSELAPSSGFSGTREFMSLPQPIIEASPSEHPQPLGQQRRQQRKRLPRNAGLKATGWEMTGRLAVNLGLTLVALSALVRLVLYHQTQLQVLSDVEASVETATAHNQRLRADFTRYFDPTQASQLIQENGARDSEEHIPIVWVNPLSTPAESGPSSNE
jgi:hypothetical protein